MLNMLRVLELFCRVTDFTDLWYIITLVEIYTDDCSFTLIVFYISGV